YNHALNVEKLARLQIQSIEIEGPIQKEWPPPSHKALFFTGDKKQEVADVRAVFARLLPRAYRRPVAKEEIDAVVAVVQEARIAGKLSYHEAMRLGLQRVLCAPGFLFLGEPAGDHAKPRS